MACEESYWLDGALAYVAKAFEEECVEIVAKCRDYRQVVVQDVADDCLCIEAYMPPALKPFLVSNIYTGDKCHVSISVEKRLIWITPRLASLNMSVREDEVDVTEKVSHIPFSVGRTEVIVHKLTFCSDETFSAFTMLFPGTPRYFSSL